VIASIALQKAVFAALNGNVTGGVYDQIPVRTPSPYTVIGETVSERPWDTHDSEGSEEVIMIHVWSLSNGSVEVKEIMGEIDDLLHDASALPLETGDLVLLHRDYMTVLKEEVKPGETWRHGVLRYRALITT
jgi:hypothetical protein